MKKIYIIIAFALMLASCEDFTELKPKGKNLLSTTDELELLLNVEYSNFYQFDMYQLTGDLICVTSNIPNLLSAPTPSRAALILTWADDKMDLMAGLTTSDSDYSQLYGYVGQIANPILSSLEFATGSEAKKAQLRAEALTLRAWCEFLLVNKYAAAYDPSTAETTPGIPYVLEDWDITVPPEQWSVARVYDQILKDCDDAIALDALPETAVNQMRMNKACPVAVKALALIGMQRFDEAEAAAKQVLAVNDAVADYWSDSYTQQVMCFMIPTMFTPAVYRPQLACEEDLFHTHSVLNFMPLRAPECEAALEGGHSALVRMPTDGMRYNYMMNQGQMTQGVSGYTTIWDMDASSSWNMYGLKTTHQYLIIAECELRKGNIDEAMRYLDIIRSKRIDPSVYAPLEGTVTDKAEAVAHLKQTALGENVYSVYNFIGRKRWNKLEDMKETLTRTILGQTYTLEPDSPMWIFPFPSNAVDNNPNLHQNYKSNEK